MIRPVQIKGSGKSCWRRGFTTALTVKLAAGEKIEDAMRFANLAGALAVTRLGALPSPPTREEVAAFAARATPAKNQD
jgi:ribokinase